jgi:flagellin-like protein
MRIGIRKKRRNRAVSSIVGSMLMIVITLSLAAILIAWAGTSYGTFTSGSQIYFGQRQQALQERFVIENVFFNKTGTSGANHTIMVFVRNVGVQQIQIVAIYVNGTSNLPAGATGKPYLCTPPQTNGPITLPVGGVCEFNLQWPTVWNSPSMFTIVVATARGNQAMYVARGP